MPIVPLLNEHNHAKAHSMQSLPKEAIKGETVIWFCASDYQSGILHNVVPSN
jgi:hypothetical protein